MISHLQRWRWWTRLREAPRPTQPLRCYTKFRTWWKFRDFVRTPFMIGVLDIALTFSSLTGTRMVLSQERSLWRYLQFFLTLRIPWLLIFTTRTVKRKLNKQELVSIWIHSVNDDINKSINQASKNLTREQIELVFQVGAPQVFSIIRQQFELIIFSSHFHRAFQFNLQFVFRDLTPTKMENWVEQSSKGWWKVESDFPTLDSTWCYTVVYNSWSVAIAYNCRLTLIAYNS